MTAGPNRVSAVRVAPGFRATAHCVTIASVTVSGDVAHYLCNNCGRDLTGVRLSVACICGANSRRRIDGEGVAYRRPLTAQSPPWDPLKDWTVKYLQLTWNVSQLRLMYKDSSHGDAAEVRRIVDSTFAACVSLGEWLTFGAEPASVSSGDISRLLGTEPLCVCVALTAPDDGTAATSTVIPVAFASRHQYWVEYRRPGAKTVRYDALGLAEECLQVWRSFLVARGVELPTWQIGSAPAEQ